MSIAELSSPPIAAVIGGDTPSFAQGTALADSQAPVYVAPAAVAPSAPVGMGTLSGATPGTHIIRGEARIAVDGETPLMVGDRILVPQGGMANVTFPGPAGKAPLTGTLSGGSDATIGVKQLLSGAEQVQVDLAAGDLFVAMPEEAGDASLAVRKKGSSGGSGLDNFGLGALGLAGLAGLASQGGGDNTGILTAPGMATLVASASGGQANAAVAADAPVPAQALLAPTAVAVDQATNALGSGLLQGSGLNTLTAPLDGAVLTLTSGLSDALSPVVGSDFTSGNANALDPLDNTVNALTAPLASSVSPVIDSLLGNGATQSLLEPAATQVDFVTDAVSGLTSAVGLGALTSGLATGEALLAPVTDAVTGLVGGLLGGVTAPVGDLLGGLTGSDGLNLGGVVGGLLNPVTDLVGDLAGGLLGTGTDGGIGSGLGGLLTPVLGEGGVLAPVLDPVTDVVGGLTGGVLQPVVDNVIAPVLGPVLGPVLEPILGDSSPLAPVLSPVTGLLNGLTGGLLDGLTGGLLSGNTVTASPLTPQASGPVQDLLGDLPILSATDTGDALNTGTDLLNGVSELATAGTSLLGTGTVTAATDGLLAPVSDTLGSLGTVVQNLPGISSAGDATTATNPLAGLLERL